jgi:hypothetical protein
VSHMVLGYIDAGSGSLLLQLLIGGIAGLAAYARFNWRNLRQRFQRGEAGASETVREET